MKKWYGIAQKPCGAPGNGDVPPGNGCGPPGNGAEHPEMVMYHPEMDMGHPDAVRSSSAAFLAGYGRFLG